VKAHTCAVLLFALAACGPQGAGHGDWSGDEEREEYVQPVRVVAPSRGEVEDYIETQATLEADRRADIHAEMDGRIVEKLRDIGDCVGNSADGKDPFLLARIDTRDRDLALQDSEIKLEEQRGHLQELELERNRATRELEQSRITQAETEASLKRAETGKLDGTLSIEEFDKARFARDLARAKVQVAQAALEKAELALVLGKIDVRKAQVARDRAALAKEKAGIVAPFPGVVSRCEVRVGERVRTGDLLYRVEDPSSLVIFGDIPVRQASRVRTGNPVVVTSTATPGNTRGRVAVVAPTVDKESGTVSVKIRVEPAQGFKPGLFVTLGIVVEVRKNALVVPKRAVLHQEGEGSYLFVIEESKARRVNVRTGFERGDTIEILEGIDDTAQVVVEGQDTLPDGAAVEIKPA
jgi:multidrug efflux pump subunit AcrA (membrane-fusion protein)